MSGGVVLIPCAERDDIVDTVDSVQAYLPGVPIVVIDDGIPQARRSQIRGLVTLLPPLRYPRNFQGGLFSKDCYGLKYILANHETDFIIRLDADALIVGHGLEKVFTRTFAQDERIGMAGVYRLTPSGEPRDFSPIARAIGAETIGFRSWVRPFARGPMRTMLAAARPQGYEPGEHVLGAVCGLRTRMVEDWEARGWLNQKGIHTSRVSDDCILGLATRGAGYALGEMGGLEGVLAVSWQSLPNSPEKIIRSPAIATHSVRRWADWNEARIRAYFREQRQADRTAYGI